MDGLVLQLTQAYHLFFHQGVTCHMRSNIHFVSSSSVSLSLCFLASSTAPSFMHLFFFLLSDFCLSLNCIPFQGFTIVIKDQEKFKKKSAWVFIYETAPELVHSNQTN